MGSASLRPRDPGEEGPCLSLLPGGLTDTDSTPTFLGTWLCDLGPVTALHGAAFRGKRR